MKITVYTDGACQGNPGGPGGWGFLIEYDGGKTSTVKSHGGEKKTTNNRMELMAAIQALEFLNIGHEARTEDWDITVYSDSNYVVQGISTWIHAWKRNNWKQGTVKNRDLWERLDAVKTSLGPGIRFEHVMGHSGIAGNEEADRLANVGLSESRDRT